MIHTADLKEPIKAVIQPNINNIHPKRINSRATQRNSNTCSLDTAHLRHPKALLHL